MLNQHCLRGECSTHLSAVAESRVRIPAPCKYCKAVSAAATAAAVNAVAASAVAASAAAAEATKNRKRPKATKNEFLELFKIQSLLPIFRKIIDKI